MEVKIRYLPVLLMIITVTSVFCTSFVIYQQWRREGEVRKTPGILNIAVVEHVRITVIYDNNPYDKRLKTAWGFSCLIIGGFHLIGATEDEISSIIEQLKD